MNDYPNESDAIREDGPWAVEPPQERVEAEQKEKEKVSTSIGVIRDVLDWFDSTADFYKSVDALAIDEKTPESDAKLAVLMSKRMRVEFQSKAAEFKGQFAQYLKEEPADAA